MTLVSYSDSEDSDTEKLPKIATAAPEAVPSTQATQKIEARKIKVNLPVAQPEPEAQDAIEPPTKRARTAGTFGGFNSILPPPKRTAAPSTGLGKGVNLKTSFEAAFSRSAPALGYNDAVDDGDQSGNRMEETDTVEAETKKPQVEKEVKIIGKTTRFKPLSVAQNKSKAKKKPKADFKCEFTSGTQPDLEQHKAESVPSFQSDSERAKEEKRSLFSVASSNLTDADAMDGGIEDYEFLTAPKINPSLAEIKDTHYEPRHQQSATPANSLEAAAVDLNLTPSERRQLLGRNGASAVNVAHFNMDDEYAANEQIRQSGDAVEHRAVKSIAPGKHSLQQLVNNARSNQESIEDKWAEGRRNRGEGGSKYGWSRG